MPETRVSVAHEAPSRMDLQSREQYLEPVREEYWNADKKRWPRLLNEASSFPHRYRQAGA